MEHIYRHRHLARACDPPSPPPPSGNSMVREGGALAFRLCGAEASGRGVMAAGSGKRGRAVEGAGRRGAGGGFAAASVALGPAAVLRLRASVVADRRGGGSR